MRTRIVCTLGPASESDEVLLAMIEAGMSFARLNFSHGTPEEHRHRAQQVRRLAKQAAQSVELIQDLQGPKVRTVQTPRMELRRGSEVDLVDAPGKPEAIQISEPALLNAVLVGHHIYLDDGEIELEAIDRTPTGLRCQVLIGGSIEGNQGVIFPSTVLPLPALTEKDIADAAIGKEIGFEWVALSFVQQPADIHSLRPHIATDARVIAKIETPAALRQLPAIIAAADASMVARGDLGVTIRRARVPLVQKEIIAIARERGRVAIVATEMLLSMVQHAHPTRAEVADVATAVLDGANAVMLSEETAIGAYPAQTVGEMREIIETIEGSQYYTW